MKKYRFFYHYNKPEKKMSVHFKGKCYVVDDILCHTICETKHNKRQPYVVMQGFAESVEIKNDKIIIK